MLDKESNIIECLKRELKRDKWKNVEPAFYADIDFDLSGSRKTYDIISSGLTKWAILIKVLPVLDQETMAMWKIHFRRIAEKIGKKYFFLCLLSENVTIDISNSLLLTNVFGLTFGILGKSKGGNVFVIDMKSKQIFGEIPSRPSHIQKFSENMKTILSYAVAQAIMENTE